MKTLLRFVVLFAIAIAPAALYAQKAKKVEFKVPRTDNVANAAVRIKVTKDASQFPMIPPKITAFSGKTTDTAATDKQYVVDLKEMWTYDCTTAQWHDPDNNYITIVELKTTVPKGLKAVNGVRGSAFLADYDAFMKTATPPANEEELLEIIRYLTDNEPTEPKFAAVNNSKDIIIQRVNVPPISQKIWNKNLTLHLFYVNSVKYERAFLVFYWGPSALDTKQFERFQTDLDKGASGFSVTSRRETPQKKDDAQQAQIHIFDRTKAMIVESLRHLPKGWTTDQWGSYFVRVNSRNKKLLKSYEEELSFARAACTRYFPYESTHATQGIITIFGNPADFRRYLPYVYGQPTPRAHFYSPNRDIVLCADESSKSDSKKDKKTADPTATAIYGEAAEQFFAGSVGYRELHPVYALGLSNFMQHAQKVRGRNIKVVPPKEAFDKWASTIPSKDDLLKTINDLGSQVSRENYEGDKDKDGFKKNIAYALIYFMMKSPAVYDDKKYEEIPGRYLELLRTGHPSPYTEALKDVKMADFIDDMVSFYTEKRTYNKCENYIPNYIVPGDAKKPTLPKPN